ncbi:hypothetical protein [Methyloversatilis thermotolerans]|uniref:hypothetical protein n=1 Tax=Methyloversatilis thermotolerans TaxID=1346290 RepID=UPI00035D0339|nr:hypothetical protein [Methyloversatilis thermotolerans]
MSSRSPSEPIVQTFSASARPFKTEAGRTEIANRRLGLSVLERRLLILADGRQDIAALSAGLGYPRDKDETVRAALAALLNNGLLDIDRPTPGPSRRSVALARLYLLESMERALRGRTDTLLPALRQATDETSLLRALALCEQVLRDAGAHAQARAIRARFLELLPDDRRQSP